MKGCSDIVGVINAPGLIGRHLAIEVKRRHGGVQGKDQQDFQCNLEHYHGIYLLVSSAEQLVRELCQLQEVDAMPYITRLSHLHTPKYKKQSGTAGWSVLILALLMGAAIFIHSLIMPIIVNLLK